MNLGKYNNSDFNRGRSRAIELSWLFLDFIYVRTNFPGNKLRQIILRLFGSSIGHNVLLRPKLRIKFPWKLSIGDNSWIGEDVWIDNLDEVEIGNNCCVSQGVYLCTGNHDWSKETFDLKIGRISIENSVWLGAMSSVAPNTTMYSGSILTMGSSLYTNAESNGIYSGVPARLVKQRKWNDNDTQ